MLVPVLLFALGLVLLIKGADFFVDGSASVAKLLGVPAQTLAEKGAVSPETARAMSVGARRALGVDYAVAVTGFAGPGGDSVGLVYVSVASENGVTVEFTEVFEDYMSTKGYEPQYGARPIKRLMQKELVNLLAKSILEGHVRRDSVITVSIQDGQIVFR